MLSLLIALWVQSDPPPPVAVRGATVAVEPGRVLENATVVLRRGLIEAVGVDIAVPPDARIVDGKGLHVYAGFIDARARFGLPETKQSSDQVRSREGAPPDFTRGPLFGMQDANRRGLRPDLNACEFVAPSESDTKKWHAAGFAFVVTAADEEFLSGTSALLSLNEGTRRGSILTPRWGMHAAFRASGEGYPRTPMGALAHVRQFLHDAKAYRERWKDYRAAPRGKTRPPFDPSLESILPVLDRKSPLVFEADTEIQIHRALAFASEFEIRLVIEGGGESWKVADRLREVPVLLHLDLPREPKPRKKDDRPKRLLEEEKRLWEERVACAHRLAEAKVRFAFASHGANPSDLLDHLVKMMARGLTRDEALAALTQSAAEILEASEIGTVEQGKIANLTVLTAPLGAKKAKVRYVFADGRMFEFDVRKGGAPAEADLTGKWAVTVEPPMKLEATLELSQKDAELSGKLVTDHGETELTGSVSGKKFSLTGQFHGSAFTVEGEWKEGKLSGKVSTFMGESEFTAKPEGNHD